MKFLDLFGSGEPDEPLQEVVESFTEMMDDCHGMFGTTRKVLWEEGNPDAVRRDLYDRDQKINEMEWENRKKIVNHLAVNPEGDTNYCLVLMSILKDTERIGDYCKNLFEVADYHETHTDDNQLVDELMAIHEGIDGTFEQVSRSFEEADESLGRELIQDERELIERCEEMIHEILESDNGSVKQSVSYALISRYYKRIAAHLGNIATSVVMPLHKLDYFDEDYITTGERSP